MPIDPTPLRFTTAREMLAGGYGVNVWCPGCKVWRTIDLLEPTWKLEIEVVAAT